MTISHADVPRYYLEDENGDLIPARDVLEWARYFETSDRNVAQTQLSSPDQDDTTRISSVFVGINQDISRRPPLLYETAVFRGTALLDLVHSETRDAALETHNQLVESYTSLQ